MISDLRVMAERAQGISRERSGPQAQRLQPVEDFLDIGPYLDLLELPELVDAMGRIFGDGCSLGLRQGDDRPRSLLGILFEPAEGFEPSAEDLRQDHAVGSTVGDDHQLLPVITGDELFEGRDDPVFE